MTVTNDKDVESLPATTVHQIMSRYDSTLDEHGIQLQIQAEQIKQLQDNNIKLENVVMHENRETRATITETNKQLMELMNSLMGYKTGQNQINQSITIARWESIAKIIGLLAGSGGVIYYLFGGQ